MTTRRRTVRLRDTEQVHRGYVLTTPNSWWAGVEYDERCACGCTAAMHRVQLHRGKVHRIDCQSCLVCHTYNPDPDLTAAARALGIDPRSRRP